MRGAKAELLAAFGSALWMGGTVSVPNLLLAFYSQLGLNEAEVMLLIHLLRLEVVEKDSFPTPEKLSQYMAVDAARVRELMASLMEKKILSVVQEPEQPLGRRACKYYWHDFMVRLAEIWLEEQELSLPAGESEDGWDDVYTTFEQEFGRPLSPLENAQLTEWRKNHPPELLREALRLAVLRGVYNFRYMDSILREWEKNRISTLREAQEHEAKFRERRNRKRREKSTESSTSPGPREDKYKDLYLS